MKKSSIPYHVHDNNRYDDIRVKKLIRNCNASAVAVFDYLVEKIFLDGGCYMTLANDEVYDASERLHVEEQFVAEVIDQCCNFWLLRKVVDNNVEVLYSKEIVDAYVKTCKLMHRTPQVPDILDVNY